VQGRIVGGPGQLTTLTIAGADLSDVTEGRRNYVVIQQPEMVTTA